jgi:PIN domain nuclease of toxin-antitoxin system
MAPSERPLPARILLDSHVLLWALEQTQKLGPKTKAMLGSVQTMYVSKATLWELAIKHKNGKLPYDTTTLLAGIEGSGFTVLDIAGEHIEMYATITLPHNDPFDTMLVAQAEHEGCALLTADASILGTDYKLLDARL